MSLALSPPVAQKDCGRGDALRVQPAILALHRGQQDDSLLVELHHLWRERADRIGVPLRLFSMTSFQLLSCI